MRIRSSTLQAAILAFIQARVHCKLTAASSSAAWMRGATRKASRRRSLAERNINGPFFDLEVSMLRRGAFVTMTRLGLLMLSSAWLVTGACVSDDEGPGSPGGAGGTGGMAGAAGSTAGGGAGTTGGSAGTSGSGGTGGAGTGGAGT